MPHYITTHNSTGASVFSDKAPSETITRRFPGSESSSIVLSSLHNVPVDPSTDHDIEQYNHDREHGFAPAGAICPPHGTSAMLVNLAPGESSPMHRTMSVDAVIIVEGVVELQLDSGETRTLRAGDSIVQRATMHRWVNVTPEGGWVRMAAFATATVDHVVVGGGRELRTEFQV